MNSVILIGRLTAAPELKYTQSGKAVANFTLAVNRPFAKDGEQQADFINIQTWNKTAENAAQYLDKGSQCAVAGRLQIRSYEKDGQKRWITEVIADRVKFLDSKAKSDSGAADLGEEIVFDDSDLPF